MTAVLATYRALPGRGDEVAELLGEYQRHVRMEPGCRYFGAARDPEDPDRFVLFEQYHSIEALDEHLASAHYRQIATDRIRPLLAERAIERLAPV
ncbi:MAG: putative quinol monooxygenase [Acidimicrobiia bacterium]